MVRRRGALVGLIAAVAAGAVGTAVAARTAGTKPRCTASTCVPSPRFDSSVGKGVSMAGTPWEVVGFSGPDGEDPVGRIFLGGVYRDSVGTLTCARIEGRVGVGGYRIVSSDDPRLVGKGLLSYGVDNGPTPPGRAVDRGNAYLVDEPPETCPEPDARRANVLTCGDWSLRDAKAGAPDLVRRAPVRGSRGRSCRGVPVTRPVPRPPGAGVPALPSLPRAR